MAHRTSCLGLNIYDIRCPKLTITIAKAIIEANTLYSSLVKRKLVTHYLNIEEALRYGGLKLGTLKEWVKSCCNRIYLSRNVII